MSSTKSEADTRMPVIEISRIQTHLPYFDSFPADLPSLADDYVELFARLMAMPANPNFATHCT